MGRMFFLLLALFGFSTANAAQDFDGGCDPDLSAEERDKIVTAEGGCKERESGVVWSLRGRTTSYSGASDYCESLSSGGRRGWQLPSLEDIRRIIELDVAGALGIGRINDDVFWTAGVAGRENGEDLFRVASFVDRDDHNLYEGGERAATVCVRRGTRIGEGCAEEDEESDFVSEGGGCRLRNGRLIYSAVYGPVSLRTAARNCARTNLGGRAEAWRLASNDDLEAIVERRSAERQIKGFSFSKHVWTSGGEYEGRYEPRIITWTHRSGARYEYYHNRKFRYRVSRSLGDGSYRQHRTENYNSVDNTSGGPLNDRMVSLYGFDHLDTEWVRDESFARTSNYFICVSDLP